MRERVEPLQFASQPGQVEPKPFPAVFTDYWTGENPDGNPVVFIPGDTVPEWFQPDPEEVPETVTRKPGNRAISQLEE